MMEISGVDSDKDHRYTVLMTRIECLCVSFLSDVCNAVFICLYVGTTKG